MPLKMQLTKGTAILSKQRGWECNRRPYAAPTYCLSHSLHVEFMSDWASHRGADDTSPCRLV